MIPIDLAGKTAIITGAGTGLGKATACALHQAGANVLINYFEEGEGSNMVIAQQVADQLGDRAQIFAADVRDSAAIDAMFDHAGHVDIVVNNAGIIRDRSIKKMSDEEWHAVIDTNLTGVFRVCRTAAHRLENGGRIVNLASISSFIGSFGQANYAAAKAGVIGLTKTASRELAKRNITVNVVAPGLAMTEMAATIPQEHLDKMLEQIPLGRSGEPSEIASVILFLCSDLASYVTGQTIHINGGWWVP
jgi:3-oxoacyl-[acyl-carrier protein] reductase